MHRVHIHLVGRRECSVGAGLSVESFLPMPSSGPYNATSTVRTGIKRSAADVLLLANLYAYEVRYIQATRRSLSLARQLGVVELSNTAIPAMVLEVSH